MKKEVKLFVRITEDLDQRISAVVDRLPGNKASFVRFSIEKMVEQYEHDFEQPTHGAAVEESAAR